MNNFAGDANCKALWRFENGALTADSKGGNTLTATGTPTADLVKFKEGAASAEIQAEFTADQFTRADANLDAGFPFKLGDAIKKISVAFWIRFISAPGPGVFQIIFEKSNEANHFSICIAGEKPAGFFNMGLWISDDGAAWTEYLHASTLVAAVWYHVGVTYQDSDRAYRIRIWDDGAGAILGVDKTGVGVNVWVGDGGLTISNSAVGYKLDANVDELVVFNDILTVAEIDKIRAGTYDVGRPPIFGGLNRKRCPLNAAQKVGMLAEL